MKSFVDHSSVAPQVRGEGTGILGSLSLPVSELLGADRLCLDRWFTLNNGQGQLLLRAQLGVSARTCVGGWWEQRAVPSARERSGTCLAYSFLAS